MDLYEPHCLARSKIDGREIVHYMFPTTLGEIHLVCHEAVGMEVIDDYIGRSNEIADKTYMRIATKMINGKE